MVRCADCGFLSIRHFETNVLDEVSEETRRTWKMPAKPGATRTQHDCTPICFARACNLAKECFVGMGTEIIDGKPLQAINRQRDCGSFIAWQMGSTPKEHQEMANALEMKKWQEEQKSADRAFQEQRIDSDRKWQESQRELERAFQRQQKISDRIWHCIIGVGLALFSGGIGIVGYFLGITKESKEQKPPIVIHISDKPAK